eukprot:FR742454.1.p1 GENE.FR742454.1~~FR742454.1.p1  ORF type:complete len:226 (+),score=5.01 FR742454.1:47-679(+)
MVAFMAWDRNPNHERCRIRSFRTEQHTVHPAGPSTILSELGTLLDDNNEADITVLSEDGKPTHALRGILRLRSTYFRAMLDSGCREGQDGEDTIRLHNSLEAVRSLIFYLHTDRLEAPDKSLVELLEMAEMMNLPRLKTLASTEVYNRISPQNACVFLVAASQQNATDLAEAALTFVSNHFASVREHGSFESLPKELLIDIMMRIRPGGL